MIMFTNIIIYIAVSKADVSDKVGLLQDCTEDIQLLQFGTVYLTRFVILKRVISLNVHLRLIFAK